MDMKGIVLASLAAALSVFLVPSLALAQNPSLALSENNLDVFNGDDIKTNLTITNTHSSALTYTVSVFPNIWNRVLVSPEFNLIRVDPGESKSMDIIFNALIETSPATSEFVVNVASTDDPTIVSNATIRLRVLYRSPVYVSELSMDSGSYDPKKPVYIESVIRNDAGDASNEFALQTIVSFGDEKIEIFDDFITPIAGRSSKTVSNSFTLENYAEPGEYKVDSVLRNNLGFVVNKKSAIFTVNRCGDQEEDRLRCPPLRSSRTDFGFLSASTKVTAKYEGNVPGQIMLDVGVPTFAKDLFFSEVEHTSIERNGGITTYKYVSPLLNPGQEYYISYQYSIWQMWASGIIIAVIIWLAFRFVFTPTIVKTYRRGPLTKDNEILVTLDVKNRSLATIKDLTIRDFVPNIAKVVTKFETIKPFIKETREGSELTWHFDSLHGQEERVLTYRIKPVMDIIGTLKLPTATMQYATRKKLKRDTVSREVIERRR